MNDYIIKEIAIERIKRIKPYVVMSEYGVEYERGLKDAIGILNAAPAADVQPVKRGKWLHDRKTQWKCSECGNFLDFDGLNCGRGSAFYCPNCGADMREVLDTDVGEIANVIEFKKRMKR